MALDTTGQFADCTPTMAWNAHFGDKEAYERENFRQALIQHPFTKLPTVSSQRSKHSTVKKASTT